MNFWTKILRLLNDVLCCDNSSAKKSCSETAVVSMSSKMAVLAYLEVHNYAIRLLEKQFLLAYVRIQAHTSAKQHCDS